MKMRLTGNIMNVRPVFWLFTLLLTGCVQTLQPSIRETAEIATSQPSASKIIVETAISQSSNGRLDENATPQPSGNGIVETTTVLPTDNRPNENGTSWPSGSGIDGIAMIGPICPVVHENTPCPDKPFQAWFIVFTTSKKEALRFQTDEQGHFRVNLPPGDYVLHLEFPRQMRLTADIPFNVAENQFTILEINYDSGVR